MTNVSAEYKEQMNDFCKINCKTEAEDILKLAKERMTDNSGNVGNKLYAIEYTDNIEQSMPADNTVNRGDVITMKRHKKKNIWKVLVPAACFLLVSTTAVAATGYLGTLFRKVFKDDVSADLVEQGYLYEVGQSVTQDIFQIDLVAVTGDAATPKLVFDVYVNDEELVANNDRIYMLAHTLGVEQYENELDNYAPNEAYGEKDAKIDNLYHVSMIGAPFWMTSGETVVVDICQIDFDLEQEITTSYDLNMEYRFTPPSDVYYQVSDIYYEDIRFSYDGIEFYLHNAIYGPYRSDLIFHVDYDGTTLVEKYTDVRELDGELQSKWLEFIETVTLVVDDKEYKVNDTEKGYIWCNVDGKNQGGARPCFPSVNYEKATSIIIKAGDDSYTLK